MKIVAKTIEDIDITPIDFFSVGHIIFGMIAYLVCNVVIYALGFHKLFQEYSFAAALIVSWLWEILENSALLRTRMKFEKRRDDLFNSLTDQGFALIGIVIMVTIQSIWIDNPIYYLVIAITVALFLYTVLLIWKKKILSKK